VLATVEAVAERLTDARGVVYRYRTAAGANADGLDGQEGTFLLCTFWLAHAYAVSGLWGSRSRALSLTSGDDGPGSRA
jgi:GH15 family glucan-1,4-alpha-glucosidase